MKRYLYIFFFFSSRRRHTRLQGDWSSDVCSSDLWRIDEHVARSFDHYGRAEITIDELEPKIGPREHTTGRNEISVLNGNTAFIHVNVGKTFRQLHGEAPMRGGRT